MDLSPPTSPQPPATPLVAPQGENTVKNYQVIVDIKHFFDTLFKIVDRCSHKIRLKYL
jgi:hypothetical protein